MEQNDAALAHGQEDIFDLEHTTKALQRKGGVSKLMNNGDADGDSDEEMDGEVSEEEDEILDEEEERDRKVAALEDELDGLYNAYQERMKERDAKYLAKKARNADSERGEWHGIQQKDDSEEEDDDDDDGGYEKMREAKDHDDEDSDSDDDSGEEQVPKPGPSSRKRQREEPPEKRKKARLELDDRPVASTSQAALSRSAELWFSQDMFSHAGIDDGEEDSEEEQAEVEDAEEDEDESMAEQSGDVCATYLPWNAWLTHP